MGNCQAAEVATVVVQHPGGKVERLYWSTSSAEVMRNNPGHYVALVTLRVVESDGSGGKQVRLTRVKLLKPKDTLLLGQVYRLITSQEVTKALRERKQEKLNKLDRPDYIPKSAAVNNKDRGTDSENSDQEESFGQRSSSSGTQRSRQNWRPSLQSIDEVGT
ncbi:D-ribose-binding periplasmic protein [Rhynchospora pubera]|uniref:D-ribose-binding periplasmic protein n=1 Tax=Rhynchospora pubera TaxID=906938 RepID=A0AAV8D5A7_9POAL|nr:D-ribose-binding periplasmic protein [Rhynchospora pubera]